MSSLPDTLRLGRVHLQVADLERSTAFYTHVLGFEVVSRAAARAALGVRGDARTLILLDERPGSRPMPPRGRTGLYHFAILLPDRASLGRLIRHLADHDVRIGAADHMVSEAVYLHDPDNLGIELYADRPRATWQKRGDEIAMATDPLDVAGLLREAGDAPWTGMPAGTVVGHVHLHVGDIARAHEFYSNVLGLAPMVRSYPGALFLAAGGYHHHLGLNTWAGANATAPAESDAQLRSWTMHLPDKDSADALATRLEHAGHPVERNDVNDADDDASFTTRDPWGTRLRVAVDDRH